MRKEQIINDNWTFTMPNKTPEEVNIPHTWNAKDGQDGGNDYFRGTCIYEKIMEIPEFDDDRQVYLQFDGVNSSATVTLNDTVLIRHDGGYSTFRCEITDVLKPEGKNHLKVEVDNGINEFVYPQKADFTFYGGIYRDVKLLIVNKHHFDLDYYGGRGIAVTSTVDFDDGKVNVRTWTCTKEGTVQIRIKDANGIDVAFGTGRNVNLVIPHVHLWHGIEDPYLYTCEASLIVDGVVADIVSTDFGVRTFHVDPEKGFFLNEKPYPLRGVCRHQDWRGIGNALEKEHHDTDMAMIREVGANTIRLAHYQHDQYFYDLCDEKGIIAWAEIPYITVHMPGGRENTISQMKELIVQNYNHASIICWALSNEISLQGVTGDLMENHRILNDLVHEMDPKRLSAMANLFLLETDSPLVTLPDIRGYNLYYGWYVGEPEDNDAWFDDFHAKYPNTAIGLTEYGADANITLQSPKPVKGDFTESYQAMYHEHMLKMFSTRPYIWGTYCWNMFDFAAAGRDEAQDPGKNHKGLITFDRKQKKDAFYIYKAWWSDEKFVHLCGSRYHDRIEEETEIKVYSNLPEVTLYVDGKPVETKTGSHVFKFNVKITGVHQIKAVSGTCDDSMEIAKVDTVNESYFADPTDAKNWFDEEDDTADEKAGFLSVNSTMAEINATEAGRTFIENIMKKSQTSMAGGMGQGVKISEAMQAMIDRQPLKKLLAQSGMKISDEELQNINQALNQIPKE